jgi:hypothetical protein
MRLAAVQYIIFWLNQLPKEGQTFSPRDMILGGQRIEYKSMCRLPFGAYVQVHDDRQQTNTMEPRTTGAINLGPSGNIQGAHKFLSLSTGEVIVCRTWTELPVPSEVLLRMEELSTDPNDELKQYEEELNDEEMQNEQNHVEEQENNENQGRVEPGVIIEEEITMDQIEEDGYEDMPELREITEEEATPYTGVDTSTMDQTVITSNVSTEEETIEGEDDTTSTHGYNLRQNRKRDYSHRFTFLSVASSIKKWGDKDKKAVIDELKMLLDEAVFEEIKQPIAQQRLVALRIHCFVVEKKRWENKGTGCSRWKDPEEIHGRRNLFTNC